MPPGGRPPALKAAASVAAIAVYKELFFVDILEFCRALGFTIFAVCLRHIAVRIVLRKPYANHENRNAHGSCSALFVFYMLHFIFVV